MVDTSKNFAKQVLELTNDFREENGLKPLKWDPELTEAAQKHSDNMGKQDFFEHTGKDGSKFWDRIQDAGDDNTTLAENIAAGQRTPEEVVEVWKNSPGHRGTMLNPNYEYLGVGYHQEKGDTGNVNYQHYWTQNFGGGGTPPSESDSKNDNFGTDEKGISNDKNDKDSLTAKMGKSENEKAGNSEKNDTDPLTGKMGKSENEKGSNSEKNDTEPLTGKMGKSENEKGSNSEKNDTDPLTGKMGKSENEKGSNSEKSDIDPLTGESGNDKGFSNDKDMLMGKGKNETLAGDFGSDNIFNNGTSKGENFNLDSIGKDNQGENFQVEQDSMFPTDSNFHSLGACQLSSEKWMSLKNDFLAALNQNQDNQYADFTNNRGDMSSFFG